MDRGQLERQRLSIANREFDHDRHGNLDDIRRSRCLGNFFDSLLIRSSGVEAKYAVTGTFERFDAPVGMGVTASGFLASGFRGTGACNNSGSHDNLRPIANIGDLLFLLVAVGEQ